MATYKILRFFRDDRYPTRVVRRRLTLEEAQRHCHDPETNSATATSEEAKLRTSRYGPWFDGYEEEG